MKRLLGIVLLLLVVAMPVQARSHRFLSLDIEARVGADGVVRVTETHTVQFDGTFSGMFQWIDTSGDIEIRDLVVSEGGVDYTRLATDSPGEAGTYFVREEANQVYVDWSFSATDEIRKFQLSYTVHNAILRHNDVAEFYYKFVGDKWEQGREQVRIELTLPFGATKDELAAWGHGPLHGTVTIASPTQIIWEVEKLPAETFVEGRVVFPNKLVPLAARFTNKDGLEEIFQEELGKEIKKERTRKLQRLDPYIAAGALALAYLLGLYVWRAYGQRGPGFKERYYNSLPANYPPAELAILYRRMVDSRDFTATLVDLARRGFLTIEEIQGEEGNYKFTKAKVSQEQAQGLLAFEAKLLSFLAKVGDEEFTLTDFQQYAKTNKTAFATFWKEWGKEVQESAKRHHFFAEDAKQAAWFLIPAVGIIILGPIAASQRLFWTAGVCMFAGVALSILSGVAASSLSDQGHEEYTKWKAFRRYLRDFSRVERARVGSLGVWEEFLPYAITLGVASQMLNQLQVRFPDLEQDGYRFGAYWFMFHHPAGVSRIGQMTDTVGRTISSLTATHGTGSGGGFSGGGGGGFGGGGGGVR